MHVMDTIGKNTWSSEEPSCTKWTKNQIFKKFDTITKGKGFGSAIGNKLIVVAEGSKFGTKSDYNVGLGNVKQMPSVESCKNIEQSAPYIDFCKYNKQAWSNYMKELEKKKKELEGDSVGSRMKKRKESLPARNMGKEKIQKVEFASSHALKVVEDTWMSEMEVSDPDLQNLDKLLDECDIPNDKRITKGRKEECRFKPR
ncbi:hypothetical protein LIER_42992 [Lithospermum erythrorhizon]|uniref:Uncharacterized protein n=1 Tax=Lithospermum erythrorhizon TaxID=34254 RepID=A0AAV3PA75_LITER